MNRDFLQILLRFFQDVSPLSLARCYPKGLKREDAEFLQRLDFKGRTVYDVGAYKGYYSLFFARAVGSRGRVISFEPHPENFRKLTKRTKWNLLDNVELRQVAIGKESGRGNLAFRASGTGTSSLQEGLSADISQEVDSRTVLVDMDSLDHLVSAYRLPQPDFIKIDVEGLEMEALSGMEDTLEKFRPELLIEIHGADLKSRLRNAEEVVGFLIRKKYSLHHVESNSEITIDNFEIAKEGHLYCS